LFSPGLLASLAALVKAKADLNLIRPSVGLLRQNFPLSSSPEIEEGKLEFFYSQKLAYQLCSCSVIIHGSSTRITSTVTFLDYLWLLTSSQLWAEPWVLFPAKCCWATGV